jgi:hypothetical protein
MIKFVFKRSNYFCLPKVSILQHLELFLFAKCTVYVGSFKCHRTHLTVSHCGNSNIEMSTYFSKSLNLKLIKQPGLTMLVELIFLLLQCHYIATVPPDPSNSLKLCEVVHHGKGFLCRNVPRVADM